MDLKALTYSLVLIGVLGTAGINLLARPTATKPHSAPHTTTPIAFNENETGSVYEAHLSPQQEPGEEEETPAYIPTEFRSTGQSTPRNQRTSRGHGTLRFSKDLSKVQIEVRVENLKLEQVNLFHIHCGRPDQLGPILVDFGLNHNLQQIFKNGVFKTVISNQDIVDASQAGHGLVGALTAGCPIVPGTMDKVKTVAGMEWIARNSELYFNLHTKAQTYFGEMRGQIHPLP